MANNASGKTRHLTSLNGNQSCKRVYFVDTTTRGPNARIQARLVHNTIAKRGIQDADIYNFDNTGFMMGVISSAMVVTSSEKRSRARVRQLKSREWVTVIQSVCADG